jgi:hypothetical protein
MKKFAGGAVGFIGWWALEVLVYGYLWPVASAFLDEAVIVPMLMFGVANLVVAAMAIRAIKASTRGRWIGVGCLLAMVVNIAVWVIMPDSNGGIVYAIMAVPFFANWL